jgi:hypothetical protein
VVFNFIQNSLQRWHLVTARVTHAYLRLMLSFMTILVGFLGFLWFLIWNGLSFHFNVLELIPGFLIIIFMVTTREIDFIQGHMILAV